MAKLTDSQKKKMMADYAGNQNFSETARMNNTTKQTVKRLVDSNYDNVLQKLTQKKEDNTKDVLEYMEEQKESKKRIIQKLLKAIEDKAENVDMFTNIRDLTMAYGVIIDKELLVKEAHGGNSEQINTAKEILVKIKDVADAE